MVPLVPHLNPCGPKSNGREAGVFCVHETHPRLGLSLWQKDRAALVWDILQFPEMVVHEDTPHPSLGFCAGIWGPTWGNKDILPSGHYSIRATMEDQAEWVSQTKPEQPLHGLQVAGKRRGVQNVISIAFISLCHTCRMWGMLNKCFAGK